ncbi:MAG: J domain-containing protein [Abditibacteriota bacterium]|nr:J domain-containing protein [Abditibacteriota bacterium]
MSTYYELLGVEKDATEERIKTRYKELVRKYHPDVAEDKAIAHEIFIKLTEAYDILTDPEKRARYDAGYDVSPEPKTQTSSYSSDPGYSRDYSSYSYSSYSSYDDDDDDDEYDFDDEDEEEKDDDEEYCARHIFYNGLSDEFRLSALKKWGAAKFSLAWLKFRTYEVLKADTSRIYERYEYYRDAWKAAYEAVQSFEYALRIDTDSEILKRNLAKAEYILFLCSTKPSAEDSQKAYNLFKEYFNENFIEESKQDKGFPEDATYLGEMFLMAEHLRESEYSSLAYPMYEDMVSYI